MLNINANTLGASRRGLPYPVTLNPELYLSRTNGKFNKSTNGTIYVNEWIDPYSGLKATQDTGGYRPELVDNGVKFDGVDDYLESNNSAFNIIQNRTFAAYIKIQSVSDYKRLFTHQDGGQGYQFILWNNGHIAYGYDSTWIQSNSTVDDNVWHYITILIENNTVKFYIDDIYDGEGEIANNSLITTTTKIGNWIGNSGQYYGGILDELKFYSYALSRSEISKLYNYTKQLKGIA